MSLSAYMRHFLLDVIGINEIIPVNLSATTDVVESKISIFFHDSGIWQVNVRVVDEACISRALEYTINILFVVSQITP